MRSGEQMTFDWSAKATPAKQTPSKKSSYENVQLPANPDERKPKRTRKSPATLPVPTPLPEAIGKGNFGEDEHGPIRPSREEVRAITENHAERLIEVLSSLKDIEAKLSGNKTGDRKALILEKDKWLSAYQGGIALYQEDFGEIAANRLDAYVRHELSKRR